MSQHHTHTHTHTHILRQRDHRHLVAYGTISLHLFLTDGRSGCSGRTSCMPRRVIMQQLCLLTDCVCVSVCVFILKVTAFSKKLSSVQGHAQKGVDFGV